MAAKVAIIIVNWNGWKDSLECLESLRGVKHPDFSVYMVDNGSADGSQSKLADFKSSTFGYQLIQNSANLGFAGGNNVGIKKALEDGAEFILLLNNDTIVSPNFLALLVSAANSDSAIGIVGPKIYFSEGITAVAGLQRIWFGGGKLNWLKTRGYHLDYDRTDTLSQSASDEILNTDYITGCCMLVKREAIEKIGLLSEDYFLYYEDVDWCLRVRQAGYKIAYVPGAFIWHKISRSANAGSPQYVYYHSRNGLMLSWRFAGMLKRVALIGFIKWLIAKQLVKLFIPSKKVWARAVMRGISDFIHGKTGKL